MLSLRAVPNTQRQRKVRQGKIPDWQMQEANRLQLLFRQRVKISQQSFGEEYGIGTQGMVWQYLHGRRPLNIRAAQAFARGLGVSVRDFSPRLAAEIDTIGGTRENGEDRYLRSLHRLWDTLEDPDRAKTVEYAEWLLSRR